MLSEETYLKRFYELLNDSFSIEIEETFVNFTQMI